MYKSLHNIQVNQVFFAKNIFELNMFSLKNRSVIEDFTVNSGTLIVLCPYQYMNKSSRVTIFWNSSEKELRLTPLALTMTL